MSAADRKRSIGRRMLRWGLTLLVLLALAAAWLRWRIEVIDREAELLAATGTAANNLFKELGHGVTARDGEEIAAAYASSFAGGPTTLWSLDASNERDGIRVARWLPAGGAPDTEDVVSFWLELASAKGLETCKFKLSAIDEADEQSARVRAILVLRGEEHERAYEAEAKVAFRLARERERWTIAGQALDEGAEVAGDRTGFIDVTEEAGIEFRSHHNPQWKTAEWAPIKFEIMQYATPGVSVGDYDGDGQEDLFFCDGISPRLLRNLGNGRFADVTAEAGLPLELLGTSVALFGDFDNDADEDLFIARITGPCRLFRNEGDGTYVDASEGAGLGGELVSTASLADYDNDGLLDIYLGRYLDPRVDLPTTLFYSRNSPDNSLLRNLGDLKFEDVTAEAGLAENGLTLGIAWADYDRDGWQDVYVVNDFGRNALYRNKGDGSFEDVSIATGTVDIGYGMSADFADVNNDGLFDIHVANVHSGQRWFGQAATLHKYALTSLRQGTLLKDLPVYRELLRFAGADWSELGREVIGGNTLLLGRPDGTFDDVSEVANASPLGWYWSSRMADFDGDGMQDIYSVNGWISGKTHEDL